MVASIAGNFLAAALARRDRLPQGDRLDVPRATCCRWRRPTACRAPTAQLYWWLLGPGLFQGVFALFTMYLPPLFPTLLRTTGAGFCYNIGRVVSAAGVVFFGLFQTVGDYRRTLLFAGLLFLPAALLALLLPEQQDRRGRPHQC